MYNQWYTIAHTTVDFTASSINEIVNSPLTAAIEAVNDIVKKYPPPYNLMASGGIDSQAMLYAWKMSGHQFNVYTFRYNETFNDYDIKTLPIFCERENIPYTIVDFDYFNFLEKEYDSISNKYQCSSPQISMHIKMASFFEGTVVYSGNFLYPSTTGLSYAILGLYRFSKTIEGRNIIPYFFLHTPELAYGLLYSNTLGDYGYQNEVERYNNIGFPVIPQERKFNGFEKFKEHYDSHDYVLRDPKNRLRFSNKPSHRPFDWLFRYPYEEKFGDKPLTFIMNKPPYI
jgi:hypothetical protein